MHSALPPYLTSTEAKHCVASGGERWNSSKKRVVNRVEIDPETEIRLIQAHCLRLVVEDETSIKIYHCVENSREYQEIEPQSLDIDSELAPAIEALIQEYPRYMTVESLPVQLGLDRKMDIVQSLWEAKLLQTKKPLEP